ncbi:hypothetical protein [Nocardia testacea]|uniref:Uncharacterized protein n=1 Tax=Nocardia testacea TaxID=248551 RepID=A0ABW7W6V6_9NOCA
MPISLGGGSMRFLFLAVLAVLALFTLVAAWDTAIQLVFLVLVLWWLFRPAGLFRRNRAVRR